MFSHNYAVFANNCVKTPLHSNTKLPNPSYLKPKCKTGLAKSSNLKKCNKQFSSSLSLTTENNNFLSLKDFYDSIPDYDDLHHLSQYDFYKEIDTLKRKQQELRESCLVSDELCSRIWSKVDTPDLSCDLTGGGGGGTSRHFDEFHKYMDYFGTADPKPTRTTRKSSAKSVRIENSDRPPFIVPSDDNPTRIFKKSLRSKSASPVREVGPPTLTAPHPFKMSSRDEDQRLLDDLVSSSKCFSPLKGDMSGVKSPKSKVAPIPITSKIPLYKQIMEDKEHKSALARLDSAMELNSQVKPFGFDNGPDRPRSRCITRSLSSPQITTPEPIQHKFKANPSPKVDSNYFHQKMEEEDYFRSMNKRVRAEELLKMATLPPSMKRREKGAKTHSCTPSTQSIYGGSARKSGRKKKKTKRRASSAKTTPVTHPFDLETDKQGGRERKMTPTPTTTTRSSSSFKNLAPRPLYPVNRPNLAATLRFEHSRRKLKELADLSESIIQGTVKPFRWNVKKTPGWQALSYDPTHEEELKLRLATRKAEQRLRQEEFRMAKEIMIQRVKAAPLLLEGPSHWGPKVGQLSHHCGNESESRGGRKSRLRSANSSKRPGSSKLSNYSDSKGSFSTKNCLLDGKRSVDFELNDDDVYGSSEMEEPI